MPLIAYQGAHGQNDYPLHFAFFEALEKRGLLDTYDFAIDPYHDEDYCQGLIQRFPQLVLTSSLSTRARLFGDYARRRFRGAGLLATLNHRFDAVCEGPGGRIHPVYSGNRDLFWRYPGTERRAILFHSMEEGVLQLPKLVASIAGTQLVLARGAVAADTARQAGASNVHQTSDIVFSLGARAAEYTHGCAIALRSPSASPGQDYVRRVTEILDDLSSNGRRIDSTMIEPPLDREVEQRAAAGRLNLFRDSDMYAPFMTRRDFVISCRLHTTILALLAGNRKILQFRVEEGTSKLQQIFGDMGLHQLKIHGPDDVRVDVVRRFIDSSEQLGEPVVQAALAKAKDAVEHGLDLFEDWLTTLRK